MLIVGIDPGATGALAVLRGRTLAVYDMPSLQVKRGKRTVSHVDAGLLASQISTFTALGEPVHAFVERVGSMPGQGVASMFAFGRAAGVVEGVLAALHIPFSFVAPLTWQRAVSLKNGKDGSRQRASELFPAQAELFRRVKDHGRADAALMAYYGALDAEFRARQFQLFPEPTEELL